MYAELIRRLWIDTTPGPVLFCGSQLLAPEISIVDLTVVLDIPRVVILGSP